MGASNSASEYRTKSHGKLISRIGPDQSGVTEFHYSDGSIRQEGGTEIIDGYECRCNFQWAAPKLMSLSDSDTLIHRETDDLPAREYTIVTRDMVVTEWWYMGVPHRDGGQPARIGRSDSAVLEEYWTHGTLVHTVEKAILDRV